MKSIIIYQEQDNTGVMYYGGIYTDITREQAAAEVGEDNIVCYIPLAVSGRSYQERKNDLEEKAKEYQSSWFDFCGFSYGELAIISDFFEKFGRRYGLLSEFRENCIC